nr:UvrD-helicase domain-containing protein [Clostridium tagluense]
MQLNVEQRKLVQSKPVGHSLIRGVAGSGKTTVAVNRIPFLLENYCLDKDDKVLMVTYNKSLISYIK